MNSKFYTNNSNFSPNLVSRGIFTLKTVSVYTFNSTQWFVLTFQINVVSSEQRDLAAFVSCSKITNGFPGLVFKQIVCWSCLQYKVAELSFTHKKKSQINYSNEC